MIVPGITDAIRATGVLLRGSQPSRFLIESFPQPSVVSPHGNLTITSSAGSFSATGAALESYHLRHGGDRGGQSILAANYVDRRWKWRSCGISGRYNLRLLDNSVPWSALAPYKKSARELFAGIFATLGEVADVAAAPNNVYPEFNFHGIPADQAIDYLCQKTWCSVVITAKNQIKVVALGVGNALQATATKSRIHCKVEIGTIPSAIGIACGPSVFQSRLLLEAVGLDTDGTIKPLAGLSYKPAAGWKYESPTHFPGVAQSVRHLAFQSVWRWFRPKQQAGGNLQIPGFEYPIVSPIQYRLLPWLVQPGSNYDTPCLLPARIFGEHYPKTDHPINTPVKAAIPAPFRIIPEMGIVEFDYPQWREGSYSSSEAGFFEPTLHLETSYHVARTDGDGLISHFPTVALEPKTKTNPLPLPHPELWYAHRVIYTPYGNPGGLSTNLAALSVETDEYLARAKVAIGNGRYATDMQYAGISPGELDGIRAQATIEAGDHVEPSTRIGQGVEVDPWTKQPRHRRSVE